jgi:hypothetical protein
VWSESISLNPFVVFGVTSLTALAVLTLVSQCFAIYEDQVIVCVPNTDTEQKDNICHLYDTDDLDWYQDAFDGSFFNQDDSFNMEIVD